MTVQNKHLSDKPERNFKWLNANIMCLEIVYILDNNKKYKEVIDLVFIAKFVEV